MTPDVAARFAVCLQQVLAFEGGYVRHPQDRGGATNHGITQAIYDAWRAGRGQASRPVLKIQSEEVAAIYRTQYWDAARCGVLPPPLDLMLFDAAVLSGVTQAVRILQLALGCAVDGVFGPETLKAGLACDPQAAAARYLELRRTFFHSLVERRPDQRAFLSGWLNRLDRLEAQIAHAPAD